MLFLCYPRCITCQKAHKWLDEKQLPYELRHIANEPPTVEELRRWHALSGLPLRRFFNTSGLLYKSMGLKDQLPTMTEEAQLRLLASDGMLVKRPLLVTDNAVIPGFRETQWQQALEGKVVSK